MISRIALLIGGIALALFAGANALGNIYRNTQPFLAAQMSPHNGMVLSKRADVQLQRYFADGKFNIPAKVAASAGKDALAALRYDPMSGEALRNLAIIRSSKGDDASARKLMLLAQRLTRRDSTASAWLIADYGKRNDLTRLLRQYDIAMRANERVRSVMAPRLAMTLAYEEVVTPMAKLLDANPVWAPEFWEQAFRFKQGLVNLAKVRAASEVRINADQRARDEALIRSLVEGGDISTARDLLNGTLTRQYRLATATPAGAIVKNSNFANTPVFPPFDWEALSTGNYAGYIDPSSRTLTINSAGSSGGEAARQLVRLRPGNYLLKANGEGSAASEYLPDIRIRCAGQPGEAQTLLRVHLGQGTVSKTFAQPADGCSDVWVIVEANAAELASSTDYILRSISITPSVPAPTKAEDDNN